jgi:hypothetical protein
LALRATNRKARCFLKGQRFDEARQCLAKGRRPLREDTVPADEARYCEAEFTLTELLITEHEAFLNPEDPKFGKTCVSVSGKLVEVVSALPSRRLQIEAYLHHGLAHIRYGDEKQGNQKLEEAEKLMEDSSGPLTANIGILLARAEARLTGNPTGARQAGARAALASAQELLPSVRSTFLEEWFERLSTRLHRPAAFNFDPNKVKYREVQELTKRAYIRSLQDRFGNNVSIIAKKGGFSRTAGYAIIEKYGYGGPDLARSSPAKTIGGT